MINYLKGIWAALNNRTVALKYSWTPKSRSKLTSPVYDAFLPRIHESKAGFYAIINDIIQYADQFKNVPGLNKNDPDAVYWKNDYLPGLDMVTIYAVLNKLKPEKILEIGSGHSTAVMRKAIQENHLRSVLTCIDPAPRRKIAKLADHYIGQSLESLDDYSVFFNLGPGDILFFDGSHIALGNSDVTVFFMEILPFLPAGVYVHVHDIYLPYDYPENMVRRGYNEQYLLAQALGYHPGKFEIIFPAFWVSQQPELKSLLENKFWSKMNYTGMEKHGGSFWIKII